MSTLGVSLLLAHFAAGRAARSVAWRQLLRARASAFREKFPAHLDADRFTLEL